MNKLSVICREKWFQKLSLFLILYHYLFFHLFVCLFLFTQKNTIDWVEAETMPPKRTISDLSKLTMVRYDSNSLVDNDHTMANTNSDSIHDTVA